MDISKAEKELVGSSRSSRRECYSAAPFDEANIQLRTAIPFLAIYWDLHSGTSSNHGQFLSNDSPLDFLSIDRNSVIVLGPLGQPLILALAQAVIIGKCALQGVTKNIHPSQTGWTIDVWKGRFCERRKSVNSGHDDEEHQGEKLSARHSNVHSDIRKRILKY